MVDTLGMLVELGLLDCFRVDKFVKRDRQQRLALNSIIKNCLKSNQGLKEGKP